MVKPLYQRQLGVLFYDEKASNPDAKFEIYSRKSHAGSFEKILVDPNYPEIEVPSLIELLDEENSDFDETRYSLLKWMTSPKLLKNAELAELPNKYFLDTLVVVFLKDIEAITCEEADIFMFSCIKVEKGETNVEYPTVIDERAFRLAFVFEKIREALYISLEIVGLKKHSVSQSNFENPNHNLVKMFFFRRFHDSTVLSSTNLTWSTKMKERRSKMIWMIFWNIVSTISLHN